MPGLKPLSRGNFSGPSPDELDRWIDLLRKGAAVTEILPRMVSSYSRLYGIFVRWVVLDVAIERVQFTDRVLDIEISGGPRWRLPACWLEGKLTFLQDLGLLEHCGACSRVHPVEFNCEGVLKDVSSKP